MNEDQDCKCETCGYTIIIDVHHSWLDKKERYLCPNCHNIIHRVIYQYPCRILWEEIAERESYNKKPNLSPSKKDLINGLNKMGYHTSDAILNEVRKIIKYKLVDDL